MKKVSEDISKKDNKKIYKFLLSKSIDKKDIEINKTLYGIEKSFLPSFTCFHNGMVHDQKNILLVVETSLLQDDNNQMFIKAIDYFQNFENLYFVLFYVNNKFKMVFKIENSIGIDYGMTEEIPSFKRAFIKGD